MEKQQFNFVSEAIRNSAKNLRYEADRLETLAARLIEHEDIGYATEAISVLTNIPNSARLDVIISRSIRVLK